MTKVIIISFILLVLIISGVYFTMHQYSDNTLIYPNTTAMPSHVSPSPTAVSSNNLMAGGNSYLDPKGVFSVLYPNDYQMDTQNNGQYTRFYKLGPTQKGQTEMYDGVNLNFESIDLNNQTLSDWVDTQINNSTNDDTVKLTKPKTPIILNGYMGFTYQTAGLGEATYTILQKDKTSKNAVNIISVFYDPSNQGFDKEINSILNSLKILK